MKTFKYLLLACSMAFITTSCEDEIDNLSPFTQVDPIEFLQTPQQFQSAVDGMYGQFFNYYASPGSGLQGIPDILSDNAILVTTGRRSNQVYFNFNYTAATGGAIPLYFSEAYEAINVANLVIGQIENLPAGPQRDNILGQALAGRAMAHFDLVRTYAPIPTQSADANGAPGITYLRVEDGDTGDPLAQPERETVGSNYDEIVDDLTEAAALIEAENGEGRLNRNGVYGLLSRVYLYMGRYEDVIDAADEVATPIATRQELPGVYTDSNNAGIVVEFSVNTSSEANFSNVGVLYSQGSIENGVITNTISEYAVDFQFLQDISNQDVRRNIIAFDGNNGDDEYNAIAKFLGEVGQVNGRVDIKAIRAAEVLLNKAEAQFELDREIEALATLDRLREERFFSFTSGNETGQALEDAILFNRRVELAFEGHRFFDLKRRGEAITRSAFGDNADGSGTPAQVQTIPAGDFRFQLPIPIAEINANPNYSQNPGY